ncbi:MAG TPA: DUF3175 domain-containing protein [Steroidobacteraceae bacterium]|jgi:hypothetical protein|nr:DUF3175 domain-containing protein [Steroidobacteraceae bacterium]
MTRDSNVGKGRSARKTRSTRHTKARASALRRSDAHRWSAAVMKRSNALDLEAGVFAQRSPRAIAASLKKSALASRRRKAEPFRSAMSMLNFHINRSGRGLSAQRRDILERAKGELRRLFGREA